MRAQAQAVKPPAQASQGARELSDVTKATLETGGRARNSEPQANALTPRSPPALCHPGLSSSTRNNNCEGCSCCCPGSAGHGAQAHERRRDWQLLLPET